MKGNTTREDNEYQSNRESRRTPKIIDEDTKKDKRNTKKKRTHKHRSRKVTRIHTHTKAKASIIQNKTKDLYKQNTDIMMQIMLQIGKKNYKN